MPLEMNDPDDEDSLPSRGRFGGGRFGEPDRKWWRPASTVGRVFLGLGAAIVLGGLITAVLAVKTFLYSDPRFRIAGTSNIEATGLTEVSRADMLPVFGEDIGKNIFFVHLEQRRKQLEEIPWVQSATVMRLLPDHIRVSVVERQPVAFVRDGQQIGLVDRDGVLLNMPAGQMAQHHYSFPVVTGLNRTDPASMRKARMAVYERLVGELDQNNQHLSEQISEIDLTDPQDARVLMPEQGMDILGHFGDDRFLERYQRYKAHISEWRQQYPKLTAVDLRYDSQVVLEMTKGTDAVAAAMGEDGSTDAAAGAKPVPSAPKPAAGTTEALAAKTDEKSPAPPKTSASAKPAKTPEKPATVKHAAVSHAKEPAKKSDSVETLAARQRAAHEKAAKAKAAREKAEREKKRAAAQHTAENKQKGSPATHQAKNPATHSAATAAQGQ
jgi:cell division protein FtsQ